MYAVALRQVTRDARFDGYGPYVATCTEGHTGAVGRDAAAVDELAAVDVFVADASVVVNDLHFDGVFLAIAEVVTVQLAAVFIDDVVVAQRRPFDVVISVLSHFLCLLGVVVVNEEVHRAVAVGTEVDFIADPHGEDILRLIVGDVFGSLGLEVMDPNLVGHAALVVFPGAELTHDAVIGHLFAIWGIGEPAAFG